MGFLQNKQTRALVLVMIALVLIGLGIASIYYGNKNKWTDPRVSEAREMYEQYSELVVREDYEEILLLMDRIQEIYDAIPHYGASYEQAVLMNNKAAVYLTLALSSEGKKKMWCGRLQVQPDSLLYLAENYTQRAMERYRRWDQQYGDLQGDSLGQEIEKSFFLEWEITDPMERNNYLASRLDEIEAAQIENQRRLSVCHTNLGVIYRIRENYEEAADQYLEALRLWDRNLTAENNLNQLMGKPLKKRNIIQKMFPPERNK